MEAVSTSSDNIKYFRFLNYWVDNPQFVQKLKTCWEREVVGTGNWKFHQKMKRQSNTFSGRSTKEFGDIFQKGRMYEEKVHSTE